ncbi:integral membrane protein [Diaporthe helianthi]|uniref:Integral membrane protein n=1 Tax=Diaporthe helianthi TaxID=158607 RepID=A0A2P5HMT1_DIAHE|nr:integral membrane protein [Diaporthe helianthi]
MSTTSSTALDGSDIFSKESQSGTVIIVAGVLTGLSTIVVVLRLYTRHFILNTAGADDWTMGLAQLLSIGSGTLSIVCIVSIIRLPTLRAASMAEDPTWNNVSAALWTLTELNAAILCSSLPVLRPLVFKSSGRGSRKTITGDAAKNASRQNSRGDALELTATSPRKPMSSAAIMGPNESSDELVHPTVDETIYACGPGGPGSRPGAGYNTAVLTELGAVKTWIYSDKQYG